VSAGDAERVVEQPAERLATNMAAIAEKKRVSSDAHTRRVSSAKRPRFIDP